MDNDIMVFTGDVSLENNGGFASVRSAPFLFGIEDFDGITLRVKGDGKSYKLRLRTNVRSSISYEQNFETTDGERLDVRLRFEGFTPVYFGRRVANPSELDPDAIRTFGIMISDKQVGEFRIEIDRNAAYRLDLGLSENTRT